MRVVVLFVMSLLVPLSTFAGIPKIPLLIDQAGIGEYTRCAYYENKEVLCWGETYQEVLNVPQEYQGLIVNDLSISTDMACIISDFELKCWGLDRRINNIPFEIYDMQLLAISIGEYHSCGIKINGDLFCWGMNDYGQATPPSGHKWSEVIVLDGIFEGYATCGINLEKKVYCWGNNKYGSLNIPEGLINPRNLNSNKSTRVCVDTNGGIKCWNRLYDKDISKTRVGNIEVFGHYTDVKCGWSKSKGTTCWNYKFKVDRTSGGNTMRIVGYQYASMSEINLKNKKPMKLLVFNYDVCAIYSDNIICGTAFKKNISQYNRADRFPSQTSNISNVKFGYGFCYLEDGKIRCNPETYIYENYVLKIRANVTEFDSWYGVYCYITSGHKLDCIGNRRIAGSTILDHTPARKLTSPRDIKLGKAVACVLDNNKPLCWGNTTEIPKVNSKVSKYSLYGSTKEGYSYSSSGCFVTPKSKGKFICWDDDGKTYDGKNFPGSILDTHILFDEYKANISTICALLSTGKVKCLDKNKTYVAQIESLNNVTSIQSTRYRLCVSQGSKHTCFYHSFSNQKVEVFNSDYLIKNSTCRVDSRGIYCPRKRNNTTKKYYW